MNCIFNNLNKFALIVICPALICQSVLAQSIWHCSKSDFQIADASDSFTLASLTVEREVIRLSLRDLYDVYKGRSVNMTSNLPLSACITKNVNETSLIMKSIGAESITSYIVANGAQHAYSHIYVVDNEAQMQACISDHHPAVGYLSKVTKTEVIGPCF